MSLEQFKAQLQDVSAFATPPVISRDPNAPLPGELPRGADIPPELDPLAEGILMLHQKEWLEDNADLKCGEKGRRTGITFAEALDQTLIAMAARSAGGQNCFYIGDSKDKGREFIGYVAHFARTVAKEFSAIEEFVFVDQRADGSSGEIAAYRVRFASGFRVEALSSRPENIRGLQGVVCIDEAAFHKDVRLVLDAVNALLIWGGRIRIISTHNGVLNPFNELCAEIRAGKLPYSLHHIPFSKAVRNGLYERTCLIAGKPATAEGKVEWERKIRAAYGVREAAMRQELDCIPSDMEGAALTRVQIEAAMAPAGAIPIVRLLLPDSFKDLDTHERVRRTTSWCERELAPILARLDKDRPHYYGQDFARTGDASDILVGAEERTLDRTTKLLVELRNVPFETQRDVLFFIIERLPRFSGGAGDATGNGAYLAEVARQKFGARCLEVKMTVEWYRQNAPAYIEAITDRTMLLPRHADVLRDHQALAYVNGIIKVPEDMRWKGEDGLERHGDSAIAGMLFWHATLQGPIAYGYRGMERNEDGPRDRLRELPPDDDFGPRDDGWRDYVGRGGLEGY